MAKNAKYKVRALSGAKTAQLLQDELDTLAGIEPEDLTTFEINFIETFSVTSVKLPHHGAEDKILNH